MVEPVEWLPDGTPRSPRFRDVYRSSAGGLAQARHVFLRGCGLPGAWADQPQWRILETGFGLGLNFLATWRAWKDDPRRPLLLHFWSVERWPVDAGELIRSAGPHPELVPLAEELAQQWFGLMPGVHRMVFEQGHVLLTLFVGDVKNGLRQQNFETDSVFLDGFSPQRNESMWELHTLKAVARRCRRGATLATWSVAGQIRRDLAQCGFQLEKVEGLAPKRHCLQGVFAPAWEPKRKNNLRSTIPGRCAVVGSGLAGAAVAASLARRGWQVAVLDAADTPAAGASGLPVGLLTPNISADDNLLSRLSRCGVRVTLQQARALLRQGEDWQASGVLERYFDDSTPWPSSWPEAGEAWSCQANEQQKALARLSSSTRACWHELAGWIKPAALVRAWLAQPRIAWRGRAQVEQIVRDGERWSLTDAQAQELASADLVVIAAAQATDLLLPGRLTLRPVRGQVSWAAQIPTQEPPPFPVNGNGHFIPRVPLGNHTLAWFCGSTFDPGQTDLGRRSADHHANLERLRALLPAVAAQLAPDFVNDSVQAWTGIRCASGDRRPLLGEIEPGLWVSTAMGSRGLTFAALCAELLAARLHAEPLPLADRLAAALDIKRQRC